MDAKWLMVPWLHRCWLCVLCCSLSWLSSPHLAQVLELLTQSVLPAMSLIPGNAGGYRQLWIFSLAGRAEALCCLPLWPRQLVSFSRRFPTCSLLHHLTLPACLAVSSRRPGVRDLGSAAAAALHRPLLPVCRPQGA